MNKNGGEKKENRKKRITKNVRALLISAIAAVSAVLFVILMWVHLMRDFQMEQIRNNETFFNATISNLDSNNREIGALTDRFNANNNILLDDLVKVYSYDNFRKLEAMPVQEQSDLLMKTTSEMAGCAWILVVDRDGKALMADMVENAGINIVEDIDIDVDGFHRLCDGEIEKMIIDSPYTDMSTYPDPKLYLYCKPIPGTGTGDEKKYILISFYSDMIDETKERMNDLATWMNGSAIGSNGSVFLVDASKDVVKFGSVKGNDLSGKSASASGFDSRVLTDGYYGMVVLGGTKCFVSSRAYSSELYGKNDFIVAAVPANEMIRANVPVFIWNVCLFLIFLALVMAFISHAASESPKEGGDKKKIRIIKTEKYSVYFSRPLAAKIIPVVLFAAVLLLCSTLYFRLLMKMSEVFSESMRIEKDITENVEKSVQLQENFRFYSDTQYESRAKLMAFIVALNGNTYLDPAGDSSGINLFNEKDDGKRDVIKDEYNNAVQVINNSANLEKLKELNDVEDIYLISDSGMTMATSSSFWNFSLSNDPDDKTYIFWDIINGKSDVIVQETVTDENGNPVQYIGCAFDYYTSLDDNGNTKYLSYTDFLEQEKGRYTGNEITRHIGMLQIEIDMENAKQVIDSARPEYILKNNRISYDGFLMGFTYDTEKDDYVVFYSQVPDMNDKTASELGIPESAFNGNYNGFQIIEGVRYLQNFREAADCFIATAVPVASLYRECLGTSLFCAGYTLVVMLIISLFILFSTDSRSFSETNEGVALFAMPVKNKKTGKWEWTASERKFENVLKSGLIILGMIFLLAIIAEGKRYGSDSVFFYILSASWDRGVHIFSISACLLIIIVSAILMKMLGYVAYQIASAFGNGPVTMIRLFVSLLRVVAIAVVVMYCLFLLGIDATQLLASAGIMSVVVGLGAQSLVGDLLAGIFIIMEGSLHVGDYVMIDDVRGKVLEIGLRTTKYEDDNQNIRVICNNELKKFANMSKKYSIVYYNIPVPYNEDYPRIRRILNEEFLKLYEDNRSLKSIPMCHGIENFGESSVELRVIFMCEESKRYAVQRFMYDEIMRIFMENGIEIPFNQLDIHMDEQTILQAGDRTD
ncbi:MAG: mechanosensitive ion channel family protein [Lachnospiraceae bacterium]|nr:mechanosensitive ion channel family protein [Lachnospiraceae bacterium]